MQCKYVLGQLRKKLDDKGEVMILVGYDSTGGYKLFDALNRRIVIIRDVIIDELKKVQQGVTGYQQTLTGYMKVVTSYQKSITGYNQNFQFRGKWKFITTCH